MKPVRGLPTRRTPKIDRNTNPTTSSGQTSSGWDRFNNRLTPEVKKSLRDKWNEFYPDDPLIPKPKYQKTSTETQKEYLRRMWNVVFPDDQIDWDNFKPRPLPDLWIRFNLDFASEEEMYRQDQEEEIEYDESQYYGYHRMDEDGRYYNINDDEVDVYGQIIDDYP